MLTRVIAAMCAVIIAFILTACHHPDTFNGCAHTPGQCNETTR